MASVDENESTFTYQQVSAWREQLFDNRSLRISVEELSAWPLGRYLWAAVLQAAYLATCENARNSSGKRQRGTLGASGRHIHSLSIWMKTGLWSK
jgi:hypothetical protein